MDFPGGSDTKESACNAGDPGSIPDSEDPLEKGIITHSSILAWSRRVGHNWVTNSQRRRQENTEELYKKTPLTQITTMVWSLT